MLNALLAQLVERKAVNLKVIGSNPIQSDDFLTFITIFILLIVINLLFSSFSVSRFSVFRFSVSSFSVFRFSVSSFSVFRFLTTI